MAQLFQITRHVNLHCHFAATVPSAYANEALHFTHRDRFLNSCRDDADAETAAETASKHPPTQVNPAGAQYEMLRQQDGQVFSYAVWFQLDHDGLWRLRRF
jgi:hypothetical protein